MKTANQKKLSVGLVFDDTLDSNDGVSQQVKRLGEYLGRRGHKVVYLCGETKLQEWAGGRVYSVSKNIHVRFNGNRLSVPVFSSGRKIKNILKAEKLDLIHVTAPYSPFMAQKVVTAAKRQNIGIVGSFHILPSGWLPSLGARLLGLIQFFSLRKFHAFTSTSKNAAAFARQVMRITSVVVPNMVDVGSFVSGRKAGNKPGRIVFLGRLVERKGCRQLIYAFARLAKSKPDAQLVIAGDGPDRPKLELLAKELGLSDKIKFLGFIDEADKPNILGSAEIACFPALYGESFGLVLIEAMAAGAGVVLAGDNPGYRCVMEEQPLLLVDPKDTKELTGRLSQFLDAKQIRNDLHKWQIEHVKQYDISEVGRQFANIYMDVIAKNYKRIDN